MRKGLLATVFVFIVSALILQACSKIPCYPASHFDPPANANYTAKEVRLTTPAGNTLAGTLTLPANRPPPYPAVVLITGSSPQNRDMMGHWAWPASLYRPFRQIADALSNRGVAVLRMDDRGYGCSKGGPLLDATTVERADDNRAMVDFLRSRSDVDPSRIGILGLSEGGNIGPLIAASDPTIRALVIMAGCATNGWKIQEHQYRYDIERDENLTEEEKEKALEAEMDAL
ncbi:MAG: alpha/beta fold hydrolase, partial [Desulfobacteraceae bacterium]|nr:alpha/beta fold hydrolase [Desulfobacteraceae bacterium]